MRKISGILAATALLASIVFVAPAAYAKETITGSGSTFMNSFQQGCRAIYTKNTVDYTGTGSGTGQTQFKSGATNFGGSDTAYVAGTEPRTGFTYVPLVGGAIVFAYNIPGVTTLRLTPQLLSDIFDGTITTWDNAAIKKVNPTAKLPAEKINVVYRSDSSGTSNNFAAYLGQTVGGKWTGNNTWATALGKTPIGVGASGNSLVTAEVAKTPYSITYADPADAKKNKLAVAAVQNGAGEFTKPTTATASKFIAAQAVAANGLLTFNYKQSVKGGYNPTLIAYGIAPTASDRPEKAAAVKDYFTFLIKTCGPQRAAANDYVAVSGKLQATALRLIATIK